MQEKISKVFKKLIDESVFLGPMVVRDLDRKNYHYALGDTSIELQIGKVLINLDTQQTDCNEPELSIYASHLGLPEILEFNQLLDREAIKELATY